MGDVYRTGVMGGGRAIVGGLLVIIFGSLLSWLWALLLRAFGDLAEDTRAIRERLEWAPVEHENRGARGGESARACQNGSQGARQTPNQAGPRNPRRNSLRKKIQKNPRTNNRVQNARLGHNTAIAL